MCKKKYSLKQYKKIARQVAANKFCGKWSTRR